MLLLYRGTGAARGTGATIYIPLCFYFISGLLRLRLSCRIFTFHYASTLSLHLFFQLLDPKRFTFHYASTLSITIFAHTSASHKFTFHYASTLSGQARYVSTEEIHLHSTMLLLYLEAREIIRKHMDEFTFHYASTLSQKSAETRQAKNSFTFHYASTLSNILPGEELATMLFTFHYASTLSRPPFPLLFSSIQVYFLSTLLSSYLSSQKSSSSHFTKFKFSLIFQALSISQQFSSISGRQSQEITCLIIIHSPELLRYPLLISAFKYD